MTAAAKAPGRSRRTTARTAEAPQEASVPDTAPVVAPRRARAVKETVLVGAVELARAAAVEIAESPSDVGEHQGVVHDGERLVSHRFAAAMKGYQGWSWVVTLARVPRGRSATVCEVELLPGEGALLAPAWLPWSERLRPGDIGPGDVLPFKADDPRLEPGYVPTGDPEQDEVAIEELALARARVLSPRGREEAAQRWYKGSRGPTAAVAVQASDECLTCGFLIPLSGPLGQLFGVCANAWSPDDGKVVSLDHGCGAHSETDVDPAPSEWPDRETLVDETTIEVVEVGGVVDAAATDEASDAAGVDGAASDAAAADGAASDGAAADGATPDDAAPSADVPVVGGVEDAVDDDAPALTVAALGDGPEPGAATPGAAQPDADAPAPDADAE